MSDTGEATQPQAEGADTNPDLRKIARWVAEIDLYDREASKWQKQRKRIIKRYKDDRGDREDGAFGARFNVLWANIQTQMPSLYARNPKPDIQRRFKDTDQVGRIASDVLERCSNFFVETDAFYSANRRAVKDYKLLGRGTTWERYVPHMAPSPEITDVVAEGDEPPSVEVVEFEECLTDYIHPDDFGHNICRTPDEIWCMWRIVYMDRARLVQRFGDAGKTVTLDYAQKGANGDKVEDGVSKASIYELWDKDRKCAVWFHKDKPEALDLRSDPLKLANFFPAPMPMFANLANDSCIPTPDYIEYQDQAIELDDLTNRISHITKALKIAGVYDASAEGIGRLLNEGVENKLIPIENFAILAEKGGLANAISFLPIKDIASALMDLYSARDKVKQDLHEISGIPDIVRGQSDAAETLGAQEIKTAFAINRISDDQRDVQRFVREQIRIKVDIICGHFQLETIKKISGVQLFTAQEKAEIKAFQQAMQAAQQPPPPPAPGMPQQPQMAPPQPPQALQGLTDEQVTDMMGDPTWEDVDALIRDEAMRNFRIDIETDSTIKADEQEDKQSRVEFVEAIGKYMESALPAGQQHPELVPFLLEGLQFLARGFPVGKGMESALNTAIAKLEKVAANPPPKQNPDIMKIQADAQLKQQEMQMDGQQAQAKLQAETQLEQMKTQGAIQTQQAQLQGDLQAGAAKLAQEKELAQYKMQMDAQTDQHENALEAQREQAKLAQEMELQRLKLDSQMQLELAKARIQQETSIAVARIGAKLTGGEEEEAEAQVRDDAIEGPVRDDELHAKLDALMQHLSQPQPDVAGAINNLAQAHAKTADGIANLHKAVTSEREIVRDPKTGKPSGVRIKPSPKDLANQLRN